MDAKSLWQRLRTFYESLRAIAPDYYFCSMAECVEMASYAAIVTAPGEAMAVTMSFTSNYSSVMDHGLQRAHESGVSDGESNDTDNFVVGSSALPPNLSTATDQHHLD
jgi:hypothetical protein